MNSRYAILYYLEFIHKKMLPLTKIHLFKYIHVENFTSKNWKYSEEKTLIIFKFLLKIKIVVTRYNRLGEAVLTPQFYCIKVGFKGIKTI